MITMDAGPRLHPLAKAKARLIDGEAGRLIIDTDAGPRLHPLAKAKARLIGGEAGRLIIDMYCRISLDYDGTTRSVDEQEEDLRDLFVEHPEWVEGKVHKDHALSAWDEDVVRPEWEELMERLESGVAHGVVVYDLTRFTRKPREGERLLALANRGIVVASLTTTYNLTTADGRKQFRDAMTTGAHESDKISERSSRGKRKRARRGKSNASHRGFGRPGYVRNPPEWEPGDPRILVDPVQLERERHAVREAADRLLAGEKLGVIAAEWNAAGLTTTTGRRWNGALVRQMLSSSTVAGLIANYDVIIGRSDDGPLDEETWDRLMLNFGSRKRGHPGSVYLLSGILRCGRCGSLLYGRPVVSQSPYRDGEVRRQYWCMYRAAKNEGCGRVTIDQRYADAVVERMVVDRLRDPRHVERVARVAAHITEALRVATLELDRLDDEADQIADKGGTPGWTLQRIDMMLAKYAPLIAEAKERVRVLMEQVPDDADEVDAVTDWDAATLQEKRTLVRRTFPDHLYVTGTNARGVKSLRADRFMPGTEWAALEHVADEGVTINCSLCTYVTRPYPSEQRAMHPLLAHMRRKHPDAPRRDKR